jgi:hypothetical protein
MTLAQDSAEDSAHDITPAPDIAIDVHGLSKSFGSRKVVRDLSMQVGAAPFTASSAPTAPARPPPSGC